MRAICTLNTSCRLKQLWVCRRHTSCVATRARRGPIALARQVITENPSAEAFTATEPLSSSVDCYTQLQKQIGELSTSPTVPPAPPLVLIISGPSGVGKDAVIRALQQARPRLHFVVTATSRAMRPSEVDGVDYIFTSKEKFESWIKDDQLLEHALVYGEYKGILRSQIAHALDNKQDVVLRLDVQGAATMRRLMPEAVTIFLVATSQHELVHRLLDRKTEPLDKLVVRVQTANEEVAHLKNFEYVVTNGQGQLDQCVRQIDAIIEAEKCKRYRLVTDVYKDK